jgi:hypothetical protein
LHSLACTIRSSLYTHATSPVCGVLADCERHGQVATYAIASVTTKAPGQQSLEPFVADRCEWNTVGTLWEHRCAPSQGLAFQSTIGEATASMGCNRGAGMEVMAWKGALLPSRTRTFSAHHSTRQAGRQLGSVIGVELRSLWLQGIGASFNKTSWKTMGSVIGVELRSLWLQGIGENHAPTQLPHIGLDCWSPNVGINRDPRWGRNMEVPSEDPLLNGYFGQMYSVGACTFPPFSCCMLHAMQRETQSTDAPLCRSPFNRADSFGQPTTCRSSFNRQCWLLHCLTGRRGASSLSPLHCLTGRRGASSLSPLQACRTEQIHGSCKGLLHSNISTQTR